MGPYATMNLWKLIVKDAEIKYPNTSLKIIALNVSNPDIEWIWSLHYTAIDCEVFYVKRYSYLELQLWQNHVKIIDLEG